MLELSLGDEGVTEDQSRTDLLDTPSMTTRESKTILLDLDKKCQEFIRFLMWVYPWILAMDAK